MNRSAAVRARAHGKVNLSLRVGPLGADGYHPLTSIFQAVALSEEVSAEPGSGGITATVRGPGAGRVPIDRTNLACQAAELLAERAGVMPDVHLRIVKSVPVAGGMAGGSADAAAALVACDALWRTGLDRADLMVLAGQLGSDVPFCLLGRTAVGTGRGQVLTPAMVRGEFHWAFAVQAEGLSTAAVYRRFDELMAGGAALSALAGPTEEPSMSDRWVPGGWTRDAVAPRPVAPVATGIRLVSAFGPPVAGSSLPGAPILDSAADPDLMQALRMGNPVAVGGLLHNDLQPAALSLRPELARVMDAALEAGALGAIVSGSGPTVAALARSARHALTISAAWSAAGLCSAVYCTTAPAPGAQVIFSR